MKIERNELVELLGIAYDFGLSAGIQLGQNHVRGDEPCADIILGERTSAGRLMANVLSQVISNRNKEIKYSVRDIMQNEPFSTSLGFYKHAVNK